MILSDVDLKKLGISIVEPFDESCIQPSSYDLSLGNKIAVPIPYRTIDLRVDEPRDHMRIIEINEYILHPGDCILASTRETVKCPLHLSARVEGKSSLGRLFMAVHITAGVVDAGFVGQITLEIVNHGPWDIVLWPGMKIAQLSYIQMSTECENPYGSPQLGSHYNGQTGPTPASGKRGKQEQILQDKMEE